MAKSIAEAFATAAGNNLPREETEGSNKTALDIERTMFPMPKFNPELPTGIDIRKPPDVWDIYRTGQSGSQAGIEPPSWPRTANEGFRIKFSGAQSQPPDPIGALESVKTIIKKPYKFPKT